MGSLPSILLERWRRILPEEAVAAAIEAHALQPPRASPTTTLRLNPLRGDPDETRAQIEASGARVVDVPWSKQALIVHASVADLQRLPAHSDGDFHIQSLSSIATSVAFDPRPGESVLDLCAAPGSKTSHIAALMGNRGRLVAVEASRPRFFRLREVLRSLGAEAELHLARGEQFARANRGCFDRVLVDAPCSAEGRILAGEADAAADWSLAKVRRLASAQKSLLHAGIDALRDGGTLVYSTCTLAPEENELVLARALERYRDSIEIIDTGLPAALGAPGLDSLDCQSLPSELRHARRLLPPLEGFFIARVRRRVARLASPGEPPRVPTR